LVKQQKPVAALFGGSFDPPHIGHRRIVEAALKRLPVDTLIIEPAWLNPFKKGSHASPHRRLEWVRRLFENPPRVIVDDFEVRCGRSVRTYETLTHLRARFDVRYLVIGADNLATLPQWHRFEALNDTLTWAVATRKGYRPDTSMLKRAVLLEIDVPVSSTHIRDTGDLSGVEETVKDDVAATYFAHKGNDE